MKKKYRILFCDDQPKTRENYPPAIEKEWRELYPGDAELEVNAFSDIYVKDSGFGGSPINISSVGGHYDLVLLDVMWLIDGKKNPRGVEIATLLRNQLPEIPILIFSESVTPRDFEILIPLRINGFVSKGRHGLQALVGQIYRVLNDSLSTKAGFPMYQCIRRVLGATAPAQNAWMKDVVDSVATDMWKHEHPYQKWECFWRKWQNELHRNGLGTPTRSLKEFFSSSELLMMAVHSGFRGHLEHVLHVYFTGYVISHMIPEFKSVVHNALRKIVGSNQDLDPETAWGYFQLSWLVAATLHDVGYPIEMLPVIAAQARSVHQFFPFAKFTPEIPELVLDTNLRSSSDFIEWKYACTNIMVKLYGPKQAELFHENTAFDVNGKKRFNHGVASGMKLLELCKDVNGLPPDCIQWIAVSMGLHSLKRVGEKYSVKLMMDKDPLAFLLFLSDELQIWNRSRPDEIEATSAFKSSKLRTFDVNATDKLIRVDIEYELYSYTETSLDKAIQEISKAIERDGVVLNKYLSTAPYRLEIHNWISGSEDPLATIEVR